eukprot:GDKH01005078.1.p1 GENE.GDKH01005078.1~~GDKH01005078.1.p1  ORF type:complete len:343 (-),score=40.37 GDKH01005078.1:173-1201(-)
MRLFILPSLVAVATGSIADFSRSGIEKAVDSAFEAPEDVVKHASAKGWTALAPELELNLPLTKNDKKVPIAFLHGMGDSCYNPGMENIVKQTETHTGVTSICVPLGKSVGEDTASGYLVSMNGNVDRFAAAVKANPVLANGFNCVGFSQGANICRGYIQKYNDPPVRAMLSVHGPLTGVSSIPQCNPTIPVLGIVCRTIVGVLSRVVYSSTIQNRVFQAGYLRNPRAVGSKAYRIHSQIGRWNNEVGDDDETARTNFAKTDTFVVVKAARDSMVYPAESEHWGASMADGRIMTMRETDWYLRDSFGLKTADEAGKIHFEHTDGNHLQFSAAQLFEWIDKYFQ